MGHLDPSQGPPQLGVSCFDYKCLKNKNGKKKAIQEQELKEHEQNSLKSLFAWSGFGTWRGFDSIELCLVLIALALVLNKMSEKLGCLMWWWLGGIYSPNHQTNRWGGCLSMGAPGSPVRQPRHPTVRVLTVLTVGALTSWGTGQSGAAPDRHCLLSGAPFGAAMTLRELSAHCSHCRRPLESTVALLSRCSAGTPDSLVTHRTVRCIIAERLSRDPKVKSSACTVPSAPDTVW
jgi:hypothetical protein